MHRSRNVRASRPLSAREMSMRANRMSLAGLASGAGFAMTLAACAPTGPVASATAGEDQVAHGAPAGAPHPTGASIAQMAEQYAHPRRGAVAAAGASSWVAPAPPPAFVISTPLPPGD